jgi:hypothetical protein
MQGLRFESPFTFSKLFLCDATFFQQFSDPGWHGKRNKMTIKSFIFCIAKKSCIMFEQVHGIVSKQNLSIISYMQTMGDSYGNIGGNRNIRG